MDTTYDVRIYKTWVYKGTKTTTYWVRWSVAGRPWKEPFKTGTLAESFRSDLVSASRRGEAFHVDTGRPVSMKRAASDLSWFSFACDYVDMKWKSAAATYRRSIAEALVSVTMAMLPSERGRPDDAALRAALFRWAFNSQRRSVVEQPPEIARALRWIERQSLPVSALSEPRVTRSVLDSVASKTGGGMSAPTVINRKRAVLFNALEYAVELGHLPSNPIGSVKWNPPKTSHAVDRRTVMNPVQARSLLNGVRGVQRSGPRLVAMFGSMYFAALRPEEAVTLRKHNLVLPTQGWGELILEKAAPHAGKEWTDSGQDRDDRGLKHRAQDETRHVPCPPELTALLREHLAVFGTDAEDRLFYGDRGGTMPYITIARVWRRARAATFTPEVLGTPLAETPYALRHTAVSTWLNGGVPATQVAEWAGHSVEVLLKVYAKCIVGQDELARRRVDAALRGE
jgi:integrase